ncbi:MAG: formylglycine-generating enzyme family protein [Chthonomonadales bacterium]|nr:formylglycine-generating enzyme family protein [Chthonomonadales bacterium]
MNPRDGAELVYVPAGEFIMGSDDGREREKPQRDVYLDAFWMYRYPVTVAQYRRFCNEMGREMPGAPGWGWLDDHPIVNVNWSDAKAYADWAGVSLPTEAQWEKAARGTDGRMYPWGDIWDSDRCRCSRFRSGDADSTAPVGSYPSGASPYGCLDMAGNECEWCADWYDARYHAQTQNHNPTGPKSGKCRVLRGGSWYNLNPNCLRAAYRYDLAPVIRGKDLGFRCAAGP